jgi:hypothetical protein
MIIQLVPLHRRHLENKIEVEDTSFLKKQHGQFSFKQKLSVTNWFLISHFFFFFWNFEILNSALLLTFLQCTLWVGVCHARELWNVQIATFTSRCHSRHFTGLFRVHTFSPSLYVPSVTTERLAYHGRTCQCVVSLGIPLR